LTQRADSFFNRFKDYKIATVTLGDMSIQDVAPIFERINSTGTPLTIVDLMRAATWSPDFDLIDAIEEILSNLSEKGYGDIDKKVILRSISAAAGGGFSADSIGALRKHSAANLREAVENTHEAYKRAVDPNNSGRHSKLQSCAILQPIGCSWGSPSVRSNTYRKPVYIDIAVVLEDCVVRIL
jgi:hypothetical protein